MRILVFVACILTVVTVGDALLQFEIDLKTLTSKIFDMKELIDFYVTFAECVLNLGLFKIARPELSFCIAQKKNLIDGEGGIVWDEVERYTMKFIRDAHKVDEVREMLKKCKEDGDKFEGSKYEKSLKSMECGLPWLRYIMEQLITI